MYVLEGLESEGVIIISAVFDRRSPRQKLWKRTLEEKRGYGIEDITPHVRDDHGKAWWKLVNSVW